jgi:hypothetical protein
LDLLLFHFLYVAVVAVSVGLSVEREMDLAALHCWETDFNHYDPEQFLCVFGVHIMKSFELDRFRLFLNVRSVKSLIK